ncbi:MAG: hypothetical protein ABIP97_06375 [Chthoniobacterales bacterium]
MAETTTPGAEAFPSSLADQKSATRYRYFQQPPKTIFVKWSELADLVPPDVLTPGAQDEQIMVGLPSEEIFEGIVPRIRYSRLAELLPTGLFHLPEEKREEFLYIPASRIARHYQLATLREALPEDPKPEPIPEPKVVQPEPVQPVAPQPVVKAEPPAEKPLPAITSVALALRVKPEIEKEKEIVPAAPTIEPAGPVLPKIDWKFSPPPSLKPASARSSFVYEAKKPFVIPPIEDAVKKEEFVPPPVVPEKAFPPLIKTEAITSPVQEPEPAKEPTAEIPAPEVKEEAPIAEPIPVIEPPVTIVADTAPTPILISKANVRPPITLPKQPVTNPAPQTSESIDPVQKRRLFDRLPLFRKKSAPPPVVPPTPSVAIKPIQSNLPTRSSGSGAIKPFLPESFKPLDISTSPVSESKPSAPTTAPVSEKSLLERRAKEEIPHQEALQTLFMTDEPLTIGRTIELCSALPGIRSCILARRSGIVLSANVPASVDITALGTNAMATLLHMQDGFQEVGVGPIPAMTLYSEKGPISVLRYEDLYFLVLHKNHGFAPGVRERLQDVMKCLGDANLHLARESKKTPEASS